MFRRKEKYLTLHKKPGVLYRLRKIWNPDWFQGYYHNHKYFEGWYFKIVSRKGDLRYAIIPGISTGQDPHAFIQIINGKHGKTEYNRFSLDKFQFSNRGFRVSIDKNYFSKSFMHVEVGDGENYFKADITFSKWAEYPVTFLYPGIMGWYRFVPFMECFHGIVSMNHKVNGVINTENRERTIHNGQGYIEKDWGLSMPRAWIWIQTNSFRKHSDASFMLSVAHIPWMKRSFPGFLYYQNRIYKFATYNGAKNISAFHGRENNSYHRPGKKFYCPCKKFKG